jgi:diguanylate cyclase (GGDEF)-like protein
VIVVPDDAGPVLIADDSAVMRAVLRGELTRHGWAVAEAVDGVDALERIRELRPHIVLLDIEMPRMNGYQVLAELTADPELADIPVIFLTARDSGRDVAEGLRRGAHDYLRKPFEPVELLARLLVAHRTKALRDELRGLAMTDPLTGLRNRRSMQQQLSALGSLHRRHGTPLSALLLDVDHFKRVNDEHGHEEGDRVLRSVAERVAGRVRAEDVAGRWGGEEFLVLTPGADAAAALRLAEDLRVCVAESGCTVSIGVAGLRDGMTPGDLVREADDAMYDAKAAGRDTVRGAALDSRAG